MAPLLTPEEQDDPNEVKVVPDKIGFALYFFREPISSRLRAKDAPLLQKQVCVIPFRRDFLYRFNSLPPTPLETAESVDMLRVLEHGYRVKMVISPHATYSVDTPQDLNEVEKMLFNDPLCGGYRTEALPQ